MNNKYKINTIEAKVIISVYTSRSGKVITKSSADDELLVDWKIK